MKNVNKVGLIALIAVVIVSLITVIAAYPLSFSPTFLPESVEDAANNISVCVGKAAFSVSGNPEKKIIVFGENHISCAGQIETAIMLNRLYKNGSKVIALEGLGAEKKLDPFWFYELPNENITEEVAVLLLKTGEINSAELLALVYSDVEVWGTERMEDYEIHLSDNATYSPECYLRAIAIHLMSPNQIKEAFQLKEEEKTKEFSDFVINSSQWTQEMYERWSNVTPIDIKEVRSILEEIQRKADEVGAEIDQETKDEFQNLKNFYDAVLKRGKTITNNTLDLCNKSPDVPIALITGAGHISTVSERLNESEASYAVITPNSFFALNDTSELNWSAYNRKYWFLSVDEEGMLGSFLDRRGAYKKPPPVIDKVWFKIKSELLYVSANIARAALLGFPISSEIKEELSSLQHVTVDIDSIKMENDGEITFKATALDENLHKVSIYARIALHPEGFEEKTLEELLFEALEDVKDEKQQEEMKKGQLLEFSKYAKAKFGLSPIENSIEEH